MTNEEFLDYVACVACHVDNAKEMEYARKLIAVAEAAKRILNADDPYMELPVLKEAIENVGRE